jgi:HK97 family phage major capsid protein
MVTGDWREGDLERRALAGGVDATGGFLLPTILSGQVIDRLRPKIAVTSAGAPVIPVENHVVKIPRIGTGVTAAWKVENDLVAESSPAFESVTLTPKTLAVNCRISRELFDDLSSLAMVSIENEILRQMAVQIDAAALLGSGTNPTPAGLLNTTGVTQVANGTNGTVASWSMVTDSIKRLRTNNVEPTATIAHPRTWATLGGLTDTLGQPLRQPPYIDGVAQSDTTSVPINVTTGTSSDTSYTFTGDWKQMYVGTRIANGFGVRLVNDQSRYVDQLQVALVAYARVDFGVAHPESFVIQKGVR